MKRLGGKPLPPGRWPLHAKGTRWLTRTRQRKLHEVAWLMRRDGYGYSQIAFMIGWKSASTANRAVELHGRRLARKARGEGVRDMGR